MKILMHTCCGPCSIYPTRVLTEAGHHVMGFFYRHNIHPFTECMKREEAMRQFAESREMKMIYQEGYELEAFLRQATFREKDRCRICYYDRLRATALLAKRGKFEAFTSTLLYSRHQNHELIKSIAESLARQVGVKFYYEDFRPGWKEGIDTSKEMGLYRQQYCGCIYSEKDRYANEIKFGTKRG
ncbi:epoxyqueuosine reductase QueH [Desulfoluna sp.]|uniref:epoxyqueuosine reductase QueH n=1 Tax=Desulfoluna sp. TaxID=2045199 RepID=UPI0026300CA8|nr:epoxyqueuosine reductase QueH [Desulfoluna sp.]